MRSEPAVAATMRPPTTRPVRIAAGRPVSHGSRGGLGSLGVAGAGGGVSGETTVGSVVSSKMVSGSTDSTGSTGSTGSTNATGSTGSTGSTGATGVGGAFLRLRPNSDGGSREGPSRSRSSDMSAVSQTPERQFLMPIRLPIRA